ncbi:SAM-dependent methyltransferase, partial [Campylobacter jejuni]|nr:SAM-dependent methyltransferase [Campylobacter jejuni]
NKKLFFQMQEYYNCKIQELNLILKNDKTKNIYLFGAHIFSQYLIYRGLAVDRIKMILDNNPNKHKKRLYGTNLYVDSPEILKEDFNALVVLNAGIYNQEIKKEILKLNNNVEVVECH